ncbi:MAG: hypothetical protein R3B84_14455 [Zavarzinella sp.]
MVPWVQGVFISGFSLLALSGCFLARPLIDNPAFVSEYSANHSHENPCLVHACEISEASYNDVFDRVLDAVDDYFPIQSSSRYDRRIVAVPTLAPGYEQPWRPGSPDFHERKLATLQTMRHRCEVRILNDSPEGYQVQVIVHKELKDIPIPSAPYSAPSSFQDAISVDRTQFTVVDPGFGTTEQADSERWIDLGRSIPLEQAILKKILKQK